MKHTGQCPKCGGTEIIADVKVVDRGHANAKEEMILMTFRNPQAMLFKGAQRTTVSAWLCAICGFVELYADDPAKIEMARRSEA